MKLIYTSKRTLTRLSILLKCSQYQLPSRRKKAILYLCDGTVESCRKTSCYKRGRECRHTTDADHALTSEPRHLVPDEQGNLWETSPKN